MPVRKIHKTQAMHSVANTEHFLQCFTQSPTIIRRFWSIKRSILFFWISTTCQFVPICNATSLVEKKVLYCKKHPTMEPTIKNNIHAFAGFVAISLLDSWSSGETWQTKVLSSCVHKEMSDFKTKNQTLPIVALL